MKIVIETIPKTELHHCGYNTCGDWWYDNEETLQIRVSETGSSDSDLAVAIHELIEAKYCKAIGISELQVSQFDYQFEKERESGRHGNEEPGDDPSCPYRESHSRANHVERAACHALDLSWVEHTRNVEATQ